MATAQPAGIAAEVVYTGEAVAVLAGGVRRGVVYLDNLDATLTLDAEQLVGWTGGTVFLYGLANHGRRPSAWVGDAQITSNIEAPTRWQLYEAWLEQGLGTHASLKAGLYDLNSEFDVIPSAALFFNSSHGIGPDFAQSGENGPSIFPVTALSVRAQVRWRGGYLLAGVFDGVPGDPAQAPGRYVLLRKSDGLLLVGEVGWEGSKRSRRKFAVGGWHYTADFETLALVPGEARNNAGMYALAEVPLWKDVDGQGVQGFIRLGWAQADVNRFGAYTGGGIVYTGLLPGRDADQAGFAVAAAHNGGPYKHLLRQQGGRVEAAEVALEATYFAHISDFLSLAGDIQYILHPDTDPTVGNAWVVAVRVGISL